MLSLALLRHAKSSWDDPELDDFDRPLNARGRDAAPRMAQALRDLDIKPDLILCSASKRTRETLHLITPGFADHEPKTMFERELYLSSPQALLHRLNRVAGMVPTIMIIGHNPGLQDLAISLTKTGDAKSIIAVEEKFPTAALAVFSFPFSRWSRVSAASGHLEAFITPRMLA